MEDEANENVEEVEIEANYHSSLLKTAVNVVFLLLLCGIFAFLPGILYAVNEDADFDKVEAPEHWYWTWHEIWKSIIESACSLPYSQCEYRPYHRQCLSYILCNTLVCAFSAMLFYPGLLLAAYGAKGSESCPETWISIASKCLLPIINATSLQDAEIECMNRDSVVAHFNQRNQFILYIIADLYQKPFWLESVDDVCVVLDKRNVMPTNCTEHNSFVCEKTDSYAPVCSPGTYYKSHCLEPYQRIKETRAEAKLRCSVIGGHLLDTSDKLKSSYARVMSMNYSSNFWVGNTATEDSQCMMVGPNGENETAFFWTTDGCSNTSQVASALCEVPVPQTTTRKPKIKPTTTTLQTTLETTTALPQYCPYGMHWHKLGNFCYWETSFEVERRTWDEARTYCGYYGGDLANSFSELEALPSLRNAIGSNLALWIGLEKKFGHEEFQWFDGTALTYTNWATDEPKNMSLARQCVTLNGKEFKWAVGYCAKRHWFVCKVPTVSYIGFQPVIPVKKKATMCNGLDNWYSFEGYCYRSFSLVSASWEMAKLFCQDHGAHLLSIHSFEELNAIFQFMNMFITEPYWIGLYAHGLRSSFKWTDGSPVDFLNWDQHLRNDSFILNQCVALNTETGSWFIEHCNFILPVICKRKENESTIFQSTTASTILPGFCPDNWYTLGNKCYKPFGYRLSKKLIWSQAKNKCLELGASIATVHNQKEQELLTELVVDLSSAAWIGLHGKEESVYHWADDSLIDYVSWAGQQTFGYHRFTEACVEMLYTEIYTGDWKNADCNKPKAYICEKPKDSNMNAPGVDPLSCDPLFGWTKLGSSCFKVFGDDKDQLSWEDAQIYCRQYEAHLASIPNFGVTRLMKNLFAEKNQSFTWIGVREAEHDHYETFSSFPLSYSNWLSGQPTKISTKFNNCVASNQNGHWVVRQCNDQLPFVCEISKDPSESVFDEPEGQCPSSEWHNIKGPSCFFFNTKDTIDFPTALHRCYIKGGSLASIHSHTQLDRISPFIKDSDMPVYIGFARKADGSYGWVDGTPVAFTNWQIGEPNSKYEMCVEIHTDDLTWNDILCGELRGYICSTPKIYLQPAAETKSNLANVAEEKRKLDAGAIAGITVCTLVILVVVFVYYYYTCSPWKHKSRRLSDCDTPLREQESLQFQ